MYYVVLALSHLKGGGGRRGEEDGRENPSALINCGVPDLRPSSLRGARAGAGLILARCCFISAATAAAAASGGALGLCYLPTSVGHSIQDEPTNR